MLPLVLIKPLGIGGERARKGYGGTTIQGGYYTPYTLPEFRSNRGFRPSILPQADVRRFGTPATEFTEFSAYALFHQNMINIADASGKLLKEIRPKTAAAGVHTPQFGLGYLDDLRPRNYTLLELMDPLNRKKFEQARSQSILGDLGQRDLDSGLLDPNAMTDLRSQYRGIIKDQSNLTAGMIDISGKSRQEQEKMRTDLMNTLEQLIEVRDEFELLGGVPPDIAEALAGGITQVEEALKDLNTQIDLSLESSLDAAAAARRIKIERDVLLPDNEYRDLLWGDKGRPPTEFEARQAFERIPNVAKNILRQKQQAAQMERYFSQAGASLYQDFLAPSFLDIIGIGSGQSAAQERALEDLKESIENSRREVRQNELLNEREQAEQLLEINRSYEQEKRAIERSYEQERMDAWSNWVRQQLTDFPKLIFEQLNLQLAARATNWTLNNIFGGGGNIPIGQPGFGFGGFFGGGSRGATQYGSAIGPTLSGTPMGSSLASSGGGLGIGGTGAAIGTVASVLLAGHNFVSGIKSGLFDDIGKDIKNIPGDFIKGTGADSGQNLYLVKGDSKVNIDANGIRALEYSADELYAEGRI